MSRLTVTKRQYILHLLDAPIGRDVVARKAGVSLATVEGVAKGRKLGHSRAGAYRRVLRVAKGRRDPLAGWP